MIILIAEKYDTKNHIFYFKIQIYFILSFELASNCHFGDKIGRRSLLKQIIYQTMQDSSVLLIRSFSVELCILLKLKCYAKTTNLHKF